MQFQFGWAARRPTLLSRRISGANAQATRRVGFGTWASAAQLSLRAVRRTLGEVETPASIKSVLPRCECVATALLETYALRRPLHATASLNTTLRVRSALGNSAGSSRQHTAIGVVHARSDLSSAAVAFWATAVFIVKSPVARRRRTSRCTRPRPVVNPALKRLARCRLRRLRSRHV